MRSVGEELDSVLSEMQEHISNLQRWSVDCLMRTEKAAMVNNTMNVTGGVEVHFMNQRPGNPSLYPNEGVVKLGALPSIGDEISIELPSGWIRGTVVRLHHVVPLDEAPFVNVFLAVSD